MNHLSCADAAKTMGITVGRIQQMCKGGDFCIEKGTRLMIPENAVLPDFEGKRKAVADWYL